MNVNERRALLQTQDNPNRALDYLITLEALCPQENIRLSLRYIPDRLIVQRASFPGYVTALFETKRPLETIASDLLEDINNELVARWVQVILFEESENDNLHSVVMEDRQPQWDNPQLLSRITKI